MTPDAIPTVEVSTTGKSTEGDVIYTAVYDITPLWRYGGTAQGGASEGFLLYHNARRSRRAMIREAQWCTHFSTIRFKTFLALRPGKIGLSRKKKKPDMPPYPPQPGLKSSK